MGLWDFVSDVGKGVGRLLETTETDLSVTIYVSRLCQVSGAYKHITKETKGTKDL